MNAITLNRRLSANEKLVLYSICRAVDPGGRSTFEHRAHIWTNQICHETSLSRATVFRVLKSLQERSYIDRLAVRTDDGLRSTASVFALKDRIFTEYFEDNPQVIHMPRKSMEVVVG